jgi:hypothetical protein
LSAAALTIAQTALAANTVTAPFGAQQKLYDDDGTIITGWTVSNLTPSSDVIPYVPIGQLYEATSTVEANQGAVTPIVANLNARSADGQNYRALFGVASPQGINPATLPPGGKSTGKVYFDVTGANPNSVVYGEGTQDLLIWTGSASNPAAAAPAPAAPAAPAPAPAAAPTPAPAAAPTPAPTTTAAPAPLPAASASNPSGFAPAGATGQSSASQGSMPSGGMPAGGTTTGTSGTSAGSAGAGGNPAGKT